MLEIVEGLRRSPIFIARIVPKKDAPRGATPESLLAELKTIKDSGAINITSLRDSPAQNIRTGVILGTE